MPKFRAFPRLILSLAIPQFKLLSHISSLRLSSGHSGPVLRLSNATCSSPFSPHLLVADASVWGTFLLGVVFSHVICRFYLFSSQLDYPPRFENFPQTHQWEGFLVLETSSIKTPFPGWISIPNSIVSHFIFYILSYLLLKTMGCFSGCLMSSASDQKLFCGVCSAFKWSFDEFVKEKVVSQPYSSTILVPSPDISLVSVNFPHKMSFSVFRDFIVSCFSKESLCQKRIFGGGIFCCCLLLWLLNIRNLSDSEPM